MKNEIVKFRLQQLANCRIMENPGRQLGSHGNGSDAFMIRGWLDTDPTNQNIASATGAQPVYFPNAAIQIRLEARTGCHSAGNHKTVGKI